jgi:ribosomal-protein-alanine N-acetyltransferase
LLRACEGKLTTPRARLSVRASNQGAVSLYEREGYRTYDIWKGYYADGEDAIVMEKGL